MSTVKFGRFMDIANLFLLVGGVAVAVAVPLRLVLSFFAG